MIGIFVLGLAKPVRAHACGARRRFGKEVLPGVMLLTGIDPRLPELADPYLTLLQDSVLISGTAQYSLVFRSVEDVARGGPYRIRWNEYFYSDGTPMEGGFSSASSWDTKPSLWSRDSRGGPRLWDPARDTEAPLTVWYGGHMRPEGPGEVSRWPQDNFSRDVFAFLEKGPREWISLAESVFADRGTWPRPRGSYLGHRYGHQIVMVPMRGPDGQMGVVPAVYYEEVTDVRSDGSPAVTRIFMDEMETPLRAAGKPIELVAPGRYPSAIREDGAALVEGPLYFRFTFEGEEWEAIGFSAGSYYGKYPSCFASRKLADGLQGKPYQPDLNDDGSDFHDAGAELGRILGLRGGPGRPAVIVGPDGRAIPGPGGMLQLLVHGYPPGSSSRVVYHAYLKIARRADGPLRFEILAPAR